MGGGGLPYISHVGKRRPKGYGLGPFWSESGYKFAHFGLELGMVFKGTMAVYERTCIYYINTNEILGEL